MPPLLPTRQLWSALQDLLLDDPIVSSNYAFAEQVEPHLKLLASRLDTMERSIGYGVCAGQGFEGVMKSLLKSGGMYQLRQSKEFNKFHYMCLAHMLLAYRVLRVLSDPKANAGYRIELYPKTLSEVPSGRIYVVTHLMKWPDLLRTAASQVEACEKQLLLGAAGQSSSGGVTTLASRLEAFGSLKDAEGAIACLQNLQAVAIHLAFLLNGCTTPLCDEPLVFIPDLPSTPELFIQETERISGAKLQPSALKRIQTLAQKSQPNLRIQLLSAALISPILLFQPFVMEYKSWNKQNLIETSFELGNNPPPIIRKVEGIIWRMLQRLAVSSEAGPLVQEVSAMFKTMPWDELAEDTISAEARDWFKCGTDSSGSSSKKGKRSTGPSNSGPSSTTENPAEEVNVDPSSGPGDSNNSPAAGEPECIADPAVNEAEGCKGGGASTEESKKNKKKKRTRKKLQEGQGDEDDYAPQPPKRPKQVAGPTSSPPDSRTSSVVAESDARAPGGPVQTNDPMLPSPPASSACTSAFPTPDSHIPRTPPSATATVERGIASQPFALIPLRPSASNRPYTPSQGSVVQPEYTHQTTPGASIKKQSTPSLYSLSNSTYDNPIDVEQYYAHPCPSVSPLAVPPTSISYGARLQETSDYITGYTIDGRSLALYVQYMHPETLKMIRDAVAQVVNYPDEALHSKDADDGGSRSMFCDWDRRIANQWTQYRQDSLRWKVLVFSTGKVEQYQDFKTAVLRTMDRYGNDVVIQDQSVSSDPHDPRLILVGTVDLLANESVVHFNKRRKIYYIPSMASSRADDYFDRLYCSETVAYEATHARSTKFHLFQHPAQALSYRTAALAGGVEHWQMAPAGLGVAITVEIGEIHVVVARSEAAGLLNTSALLSMEEGTKVPVRGAHEAVWLRAGNRIVIPPCTLYFIWAVKDTVCHKRYYYSGVHMPMTQTALAHTLVLGALASRDPVSPTVAFPILCRMMVCWHTFLVKPGRSDSLRFTTETLQIAAENDIAFHLPHLGDIESVLELFSLLNTIILLPVYDTRTYSPNAQQPTAGLPESERMLFLLARQCALQVGEWFFQEYRLLSPDGHRYLDGKEEFWALSLLHHANILLRYKLLAEKKKPQFSTTCTASELQQEIWRCLGPLEQEIQNLISTGAQQATPEYKMALFLDNEALQQFNDDPNKPLPLSLWTSYRGLGVITLLPSVVKGEGGSDDFRDAIDL